MVSRLRNFAAIALFFGSLAMTGCLGDSNPATPEDTYTSDDEFENLDLASENGGYTEETEGIPGDPTYLKIKNEEEDAEDATLDDERSLEASPQFDVHYLRITWGLLEGDLSNTIETDWSGKVTVDRGALKVERLIAFEENEDWIVRPRESRREVEFVSHTTSGHDGVLLRIFTPKLDFAGEAPNMVTFSTGPLTTSYAVEDLDKLNAVVEIDAIGNQVAFRGRQRGEGPCVNGFTNGFWRMNEEGTRGTWGGVWVESDGANVGFVRGHFGVNDEGNRVLFGKHVTEDGAFRGFLRGTYELDGMGGGTFEGNWIGRGGQIIGAFEGSFKLKSSEEGVQVGAYEGIWSGNCPGDELDDVDS